MTARFLLVIRLGSTLALLAFLALLAVLALLFKRSSSKASKARIEPQQLFTPWNKIRLRSYLWSAWFGETWTSEAGFLVQNLELCSELFAVRLEHILYSLFTTREKLFRSRLRNPTQRRVIKHPEAGFLVRNLKLCSSYSRVALEPIK